MSAKTAIQALEDSELIHIFLDFVSTFKLQYEKQKKEISYKCFEATWSLLMAKATGYGRTENEAYKNALKNLLELLMEDSAYVEYFAGVLKPNKSNAQERNHSPVKMQLKTQGHQPEDKKGRMSYESYVKGQLNRPKEDIQHPKINLNRSMSQKGDAQLQEAKLRLKNLQNKLASVLDENKVLRQKLVNLNFQEKVPGKPKEEQKYSKQTVNYPSTKVVSSQKSQKSLMMGLGNKKVSIPRLNFAALPNYQKKSEKCLNQVLLAAYNQKHGVQKVI